MPEKETKSISEQIIEDAFNKLKKSEAYNEAIIAKLEEIASKGKLSSPKTVTEVISMPQE